MRILSCCSHNQPAEVEEKTFLPAFFYGIYSVANLVCFYILRFYQDRSFISTNPSTNPHFLFACRLVLRYSREGKGKRVEEMTMDLPKDPMMLYSVVNTKLRDYYGSLEEMCDDMNLSEKELEQTLAAAGFEYNRELNKFM